jgi:hypothetical protein
VHGNKHGAVASDRQPTQQADELPHLAAVDLVTAEDVCRSVQPDQLWTNVVRGLLKLLE